MISKFPGTCETCKTPFAAGANINWSRATGATCVDAVACAAAAASPKPAAAPATMTTSGTTIVAFLQAARDRGRLKFPKARFLAPGGGEMKLTLAGSSSKYPGALQVEVAGVWLGRINVDGTVAGSLARNTDVLATLDAIAADPSAAAKAYGVLASRCSFCSLTLTDVGSVEVGYGPICAKKYGLPHAPKGTPSLDAVPTAAPVAVVVVASAASDPAPDPNELTGYEEHLRDEGTAYDYRVEAYGDRCPCGTLRWGGDCPNCYRDELDNAQVTL